MAINLSYLKYLLSGGASNTVPNSSTDAFVTFGTPSLTVTSGLAAGDTSGTLLAASKFSAGRQMITGDVLNVTYELTIADI